MQRPRRLYVQAPTTGNTSGRRSFDFDFIFPPWTKQREVYDKCVRTQIDHVLQSQQQGQVKHATILAYGQTGTGKTYTMGMLSDFTDDKEQGLIPRALSQILEFAGNVEGEEDMHLSRDDSRSSSSAWITARGKPYARHGTSSGGDLPVRQGRDGAFYVADLNEYEVSSIEDAHALLELAMRNRVLAATTKNKTSSRSHTLLTISIKRRRGTSRSRYSSSEEDEDQDESNYANDEGASTISFVDLAGSERVDGALHFLRATRARQEQRIREAKFINRSLSALGGVIAALAQPKPSATGSTSANVLARLSPCLQDKPQHSVGNEQGQPHIRFRDSQLTKLLQGRLMGGRGRLLLIATVDDQAKNLSETLSTLKFASQCRRVELQPGSRLRGDRGIRLRRQKALLDQVFNNMKMMHENREAALHVGFTFALVYFETWILLCFCLLDTVDTDDEAPTYLASYTALCSLVDTVSSIDDSENQSRESKHPKAIDFQSEKEMLEYVAGLYSRLKEALVTQQQPEKHVSGKSVSVDTAEAVVIAKVNLVPSQQPATRDQNHKQTVPREPLRASNPPADSTGASSMQFHPSTRPSSVMWLASYSNTSFGLVRCQLI
ncbi:Kinesin-like protein [Phytophthora cactorum]|nr:Kinesin-like protein [Phytophthora cactorum]